MKRNGHQIKKIGYTRKGWSKAYAIRADRRNGKAAAKVTN